MGILTDDHEVVVCHDCQAYSLDVDMYQCDSCGVYFCQDCAPYRTDDAPCDFCSECCE